MPTFSIVNQSCYRRQEEIATVRRFLFLNGYGEAGDPGGADQVIFFTCAFCQSRVVDMLAELHRIQDRLAPGAELVVGACLPRTDGESLGRVFTGRTITPLDFTALDDLPGITLKFREMPPLFGKDSACMPLASQPSALGLTWPALPPDDGGPAPDPKTRMGVFIASGCRRKCAYCAIRFATGPLRSKPLEAVTRVFTQGLERGYRTFELYADSIGDYGLDIGTSLGELLQWLARVPGTFSIGIYDLHPQAFLLHFDSILALCEAGRVHYLYVPVQSGSERVLKAMRRPCDTALLLERIRQVRSLGRVFLQSCVIVGFPSETEEEFRETVAFLEAARFSDVYVHFYSDMPRTESSGMPGKIAKANLRSRLERLEGTEIRYDPAKTLHEWENIQEAPAAGA